MAFGHRQHLWFTAEEHPLQQRASLRRDHPLLEAVAVKLRHPLEQVPEKQQPLRTGALRSSSSACISVCSEPSTISPP